MNIKTIFKWGVPITLFLFICVAFASVTGGLAWLGGQAEKAGLEIPGLELARPEGQPEMAANPDPDLGSAAGQFAGQNQASDIFIPIVVNPVVEDPTTAILQAKNGIVQVQQENNSWKTVESAEIKAGQTFRTWFYSSAVLYFYDGSSVTLEANTRLTLEEVNAPKDGNRRITMFQAYGSTQHTVAPTSGSTYLVNTPSASGAAKGTVFQVTVAEDKTSHFATLEGAVAVTGKQTTVQIAAGQMTSVVKDGNPSAPVFWINGQGEVSQIGDIWVIGGLEFARHEGTVIIGNPQLGDLVSVRGRLLLDGTRVADEIKLLAPSLVNRFRMTGIVETIGSPWVVSGAEIQTDATTHIDEEIEIGSRVLVTGIIQEGGILFATHINLLAEETRFEFSGMVEAIAGPVWTIAGVAITTDGNTEITGEPGVGDLVHVEGWILPNGTWLATEIKKVAELNRFEFIGTVESLAPWVVSGISFTVDEFTYISPGIVVGSLVRVEGLILADGTWLASSIELLDENDTIIFIGIVENTAPWVVNGLNLTTDEYSVFIGEIVVSSLVRVEVRILPDGTWLIVQMELIEVGPVVGCIEFVDIVAFLSSTEIILLNGPTIPLAIAEIEGNLLVGSQVFVKLCFGADNGMVYAWVFVIGDPIVPTPTPVPGPTGTPPPPSNDGKVTICHIPPGNPNKAHTITVGQSAVQAHLKHGDHLGPCP